MTNYLNLPPGSAASTDTSASGKDSSRQLALLNRALLEWLRAGGWPPTTMSNQVRVLAPQLCQWLDGHQGDQLIDGLLTLAADLHDRLAPIGPEPAAFGSAFAHAFLEQALEAVAMEAHCSGRHATFVALRPFLHDDPTASELARLGIALQMSDPAIGIALGSLRRRFRGRIDAELALWAATPESRHTLRRQLRECLIGTGSSS